MINLDKDYIYMQRCIDLAHLTTGEHAPNPKVGAVIVHNDTIIGEGFHKKYGEGHAEVNAVASVTEKDQHLLPQSTIYVTLEPCFHFGKTPPCVDLILKHKIKRVVIGCKDPFSKVAGQSIKKLKDHGIEVRVGVLEDRIKWLNRRFFTTIHFDRPYILLKYAITNDGFMGSLAKQIPISNPLSQRLVHRWRSQQMGILIGSGTAAVDNPSLTVRLHPGNNPIRLIIDRTGKLSPNLKVFQDSSASTWILTHKHGPKHSKMGDHVRIIHIPERSESFLSTAFKLLKQEGIQSIMVEGGSTILQHLIAEKLWDEARVFRSQTILKKGVKAPSLPAHALKNQRPLGNNQLLHYINSVFYANNSIPLPL